MEAEAKYTLVGTIILVMTAALIVALVWLKGRGQQNLNRYFTIYFKKHSLSGLQVDSYVTMRGIRVGSVKGLQIYPTDIERVRVEIAVGANTPVKTDTEAVIQRNLLTGLASIDLAKSSASAAPLEHVDAGEQYPVIPEGPESLEGIKESLPEALNRASAMLENLTALVSAENREKVAQTLANLEKVSRDFSGLSKDFSTAMQSVDSAASDVRGLARDVGEVTREASKAFGRSADSIASASTHVSQDLGLAVRKLANTMERLENPKAIILGPESGALGPGEKRR